MYLLSNYLWKLLCSEKSSILITFVISDTHGNTLFVMINLTPDLENYIV